jgi:hypothetical protein
MSVRAGSATRRSDGRTSLVFRTRRAAVSLVALALAVSAFTACATAANRRVVSMLPAADGSRHGWEWTVECPFVPTSTRGCATKPPDLGVAQLEGDEWNLGASPTAGSVRMSTSSDGSLALSGALPSAPPCTASSCIAASANTWVRGYPSVLYGINQCNAGTSPTVSKVLPLPLRVGAIPADLIGATNYAARTADVTYDIAYDMWLNRSGTKEPCRTEGTVEVMVWTDYNPQALLPQSLQVGTASIPFAVNGVVDSGADAWAVYANNVYSGGQTAPYGGTVWLVLDRARVVRAGEVSVDLSSALKAVGTLLAHNYGWGDFSQTYWLDTVPFGMEFGPKSAAITGADPTYFSLELTSYCLEVRASLSDVWC